jgi:hypothetical protein
MSVSKANNIITQDVECSWMQLDAVGFLSSINSWWLQFFVVEHTFDIIIKYYITETFRDQCPMHIQRSQRNLLLGKFLKLLVGQFMSAISDYLQLVFFLSGRDYRSIIFWASCISDYFINPCKTENIFIQRALSLRPLGWRVTSAKE